MTAPMLRQPNRTHCRSRSASTPAANISNATRAIVDFMIALWYRCGHHAALPDL
jgi:hypothetical protein